jgi:hypothetical protein
MRDLGASDAVVQNARKASLGAPPPVQVPERGPDPIKSRRRRPYSPARRVGRPSGYRPELAEYGYRLSLLGLTDQELAGVLDISHETLACWKLSYPEFRESITRGKIEADARVAEALYHRACGYTHEAVKIFLPAGTREPVYAPYTEHFPPDANAALRWLMNRQPNKWRDKREIDHTGSIAHQIAAMTPEERARDALELVERVRARLAALRTIEQEPP